VYLHSYVGECIAQSSVYSIYIYNMPFVLLMLLLQLSSGGGGGSGGVNGDATELNEYAAKTHELQTIIEKQVGRQREKLPHFTFIWYTYSTQIVI